MKNSFLSQSILLFLTFFLVSCGRGTATNQPPTTPGVDLSAADSNPAGNPVANESPISALGVIRPARQMALSFRSAGIVDFVNVQVGSPVQKGEEVAGLETVELTITLQSAQAAVEIRQAEVELLLSNTQSNQSQRAVAQAQLYQAQLEVERLQWQLAGTTIRAPFDGIVADLFSQPGEWAAIGTPVVELIDTGLWLVETKSVSELDIGRVRIGQPATVRVIPFAGELLTGEVMSISPVAIVQQGDTTFTLLIRLAQTPLSLLPGMNAEVEIDTS